MLKQKAWNRDVEFWNWSIYYEKMETMNDLSIFSSKIGSFFIILLKKMR